MKKGSVLDISLGVGAGIIIGYWLCTLRDAHGNPPPPPSTVALTVNSVVSSNPISGYFTVLYKSGQQLETGFTPATFHIAPNTAYEVEVQDFAPYSFSHWGDGSTVRRRPVNIANDTTLVAVYV